MFTMDEGRKVTPLTRERNERGDWRQKDRNHRLAVIPEKITIKSDGGEVIQEFHRVSATRGYGVFEDSRNEEYAVWVFDSEGNPCWGHYFPYRDPFPRTRREAEDQANTDMQNRAWC